MNVPLALAALLTGSFEGFMQGLAGAPPADVVQEPATVENHLHLKLGLATWHIDLLVRHGCISVLRDGTRHRGVLWDYTLRMGDSVTIEENASFRDAYRRVPAKTYAMVAQHDSSDAHLMNLSEIFAARGAVELSAFDPGEPVVETLADFVQRLKDDRRVTGPVRDIVVGSHASWGGQLNFAVDVMQTGARVTTYESVDAAATSLAIPKDTFLPRPNPDPGRRIVFLGCDAGDAKPLLARLRQAMDPGTPVLAPRHWWGTAYANERGDVIEFLGVAHLVFSARELTRAEIIGRFQSQNALDANRDPIHASRWDDWVPLLNDVPPNEGWRRDFFVDVTLPSVSIPGQSLPARPGYAAPGRMYHWRGKFPTFSAATSLTQAEFDADPTKALKDAITSLPANPRDPFSRAHPFPWWARFRFTPPHNPTAAQMKDTIERWLDVFFLLSERIVDGEGNVSITASGLTDVYALVVPGTDPANNLYVNYYPNIPGAPQPARDDLKFSSGFWVTA